MGHKVLIVEDSEPIAEGLATAVRGLGHDPIIAGNARDATAALDTHDFCYALVDVSLPSEPGAIPVVVTGLTLISEVLRARNRQRNDAGYFVFPIIVISAHGEPKFVSRTLEIGGDAFIDKPSFDDLTVLTDKIAERLRLSGREHHDGCEKLAPPRNVVHAEPLDASRVRLRILGEFVNSKVQVVVNGRPAWITPKPLQALLFLVAGRLRGGEGWVTRSEIGKNADAVVKALSRARSNLGLPEDLAIDEYRKERGYRLCEHVEIEHVAASELAKFEGEAVIAKLAAEIVRLQKPSRAKR